LHTKYKAGRASVEATKAKANNFSWSWFAPALISYIGWQLDLKFGMSSNFL
jgi:hypothetical protein